MFRTRVKRDKWDRTKWRWFIWGEGLDDSRGGYESEEEARLALAEALTKSYDLAWSEEDTRVFWQQAFS